ncbi:MAG TPA: response regulator transcription factor [Aquifex aeolicus]|nr:response regulator transcription factor [Aquifex aeolicus]
MSLKVILYDPEEEIEILLKDIFEVTGHTLYTANSPEEFAEVLNSDANLLLIPFSEKDLWLKSLGKKILIPVFITHSEKEEEKVLNLGFSHINTVRIPFNPLELLGKLGSLNKTSSREFEEIGLINAILKASQEGKSLVLEIKSEEKSCYISTNPITLSCSFEVFKSILSSNYNIVEYKGKIEVVLSFESLEAFFKALFEETREVEIKAEKGDIVKHKEFITIVWKEYEKGIFRKNLYILNLSDESRNYTVLVNVGSLDNLGSLNKALGEMELSLKDINLVLITDFEPYNLEVLRRIYLLNPNVIVLGRGSIGRILKVSGLSSLKFRAVEEIPLLKIKTPTGFSIRVIPINNSPYVKSCMFFLEEKNILFSGKFLGNFNTEDEKVWSIFHRIFFPCKESLGNNIKLIKDLPQEYSVFPYYGIPYSTESGKLSILKEIHESSEYEYVNDHEIVLTILNRILIMLGEEEKENLISSLGSMVEFEEGVPVDIYTSPHILYEQLIEKLAESVKSKDKFFKAIEELSKYPFYIPIWEV